MFKIWYIKKCWEYCVFSMMAEVAALETGIDAEFFAANVNFYISPAISAWKYATRREWLFSSGNTVTLPIQYFVPIYYLSYILFQEYFSEITIINSIFGKFLTDIRLTYIYIYIYIYMCVCVYMIVLCVFIYMYPVENNAFKIFD